MRRALAYAALIALAAFLVAPFAWMVLVSLHPTRAPIPDYGELIPAHAQWQNYWLVLTNSEVPVARFALNSVFVAVCVVSGQLVVCSLAAYGLARIRFPGADAVFFLFVASMMFAGVVTQIPVYLLMRDLHWLDTYAALVVPGLSSAFNVFLLRQFMVGIPRELDEASQIDGAGHLRIYAQVVMPLCKPALATAAAFTFFAVWTDFFWPLLATNSMRMRTLEVGLSIFKNSYGATNWPLQMAAAVVTLMPMVVVFVLAQRWFVRGIQMSGIK
ncbi:MAG: carbohydrate ABC transporter permease [Armatimonadetes bacterium]|nr:carbohydrate ABC transporter permease [Armatimonadota bacterium]MBS1711144.1 carbohydrate ABC transporter permease [Armatimonadota bacterium]MBX3108818.1 carbohydrate ABC transporter permease [Fimbriimonadaceae bacterium]